MLFPSGPYRALEIGAADVATLQEFYESNPEYFLAVSGDAPAPNEAIEEFHATMPAQWPYEKKWLMFFVDDRDAVVAMADVVSNLFTNGVWHVGLFIVATSLHGRGAAQSLYADLESWMRGRGARWLRLGVVEGNSRAERFWEKSGYIDIRKRHGVEMGKQVNTLRVMAKPLAGGSISEYLAAVARDRPESP
jgi:GNAT superfamily N-acetyltransferase